MTDNNSNIEFQPKPTHPKFIDLEGQRFGRLVALGIVGRTGYEYLWLCQCDCTNQTIVQGGHLRSGHTQSCGCLSIESKKTRSTTHGQAKKNAVTAEYRAYQHAKCRCNDPDDAGYQNYGGRGIEFRFYSFEEFIEHIGYRPSVKHSLDRINNNGHYEVGNVQWSTRTAQNKNRRCVRWITFENKTHTLMDWSRITGIRRLTLRKRLEAGWTVEEALTIPLQKSKHWR